MSRWVACAALVLGLASGPLARAGEPENVAVVTGAATEEVKATVDGKPLALGTGMATRPVRDGKEDARRSVSALAARGPLPATDAKTAKPLPSTTTKKMRDLGY
ncbi:hypothetical protein [Polyangium jinanense]|uniref:Uncharacterized protein n=1 Tax=Polyangium jinanense TaxID=2829994 RepID=A0A9X3WYG8_9BACT|nr:hypothetical protein [Polyangium jinanense]MDC3953325.1 hypothetical protein [Polyangium jinanense]MDC3979555.1 hypothetical protein [Polyangium jinanense]